MNKYQKAHILTDAVFELDQQTHLKLFDDDDYVPVAYDFATPDEVREVIRENMELIKRKVRQLWSTVYDKIAEEL